jgi:hypothetical protein
VSTLKTLYPEHYEKMAAQVMTSMMEHVHDDGNIPYRLRQGLSMFLGQPLDTTLQPQSIMAVQSVFGQSGPPQPQQGAKPKGSAAKLGKMATNLQTNDQARSARANKA